MARDLCVRLRKGVGEALAETLAAGGAARNQAGRASAGTEARTGARPVGQSVRRGAGTVQPGRWAGGVG